MAGEDLTNREFIGTILPDEDSMHQGKYRVNVPVLQPHMKETEGIWCKNHTCRWRVSPSGVGVCGSYYPLQAGMSVIVKFFANHIESAYIDRVVSDGYVETLPYEIIERDNYYQIIRTPKHNNLIAIYEGDNNSKNVPKNSIHVYFNDTRTTVVIDETGLNIKTADNINMTVGGNIKITVTGSADIKATGNVNIESATDANVKTGGNVNVEAGGVANMKGSTVNIESSGVMNLKSGGAMNIQGAPVGLNGVAAPAGTAASAALADDPTLINPLTDYEYFTRNTGK